MKVQSKDTIISQLIELLQKVKEDDLDYQIQTGWIEALMWTIGLTEDEKNVFKYSKEEIIEAVDIAIGDDGNRSKEVIAILEDFVDKPANDYRIGERNE